jgi:hypothetical protein
VKAVLVNWLPWSVLKISGLPNRASASSIEEFRAHIAREIDKWTRIIMAGNVKPD